MNRFLVLVPDVSFVLHDLDCEAEILVSLSDSTEADVENAEHVVAVPKPNLWPIHR